MRTPLTIILGIAHKMEEKPDRWFREGLHLIKKNGQELLQLVNRVLDLAKLDAGMITVHLQQADLAAFLRVLAEMFRSYAESKNLAFELAFPESPVLMDFDSEKMKDIVSNLLSNAIKFSKPGGRVILKLKPYQAPQVAYRLSIMASGFRRINFPLFSTGSFRPMTPQPVRLAAQELDWT
ncbi:MAG: HAMP domain-containing histidine kinase [Haliscomenobacter sp.]|nr:HAMP domain-containing histidine kinase [Haliscomenobacter sp.]